MARIRGIKIEGRTTYLFNSAACAFISIWAVAIYVAVADDENLLKLLGLSTVVAMAAFWAVGLVGFIFGLPPASGANKPANQSLEEIAGWLTKVIVGATLVEIRSISAAIAEIGSRVGDLVGEGGSAAFTALIIAAGACGFVFFYFWACIYWDDLRGKPISQRLNRVDELESDGTISSDERNDLRRAILDELVTERQEPH